jgi:hypothetical protein
VRRTGLTGVTCEVQCLTGLTGHHHRSDRWSTVSSSVGEKEFNLVVTPIHPPLGDVRVLSEAPRSKGGDWALKWAGPAGLGPVRGLLRPVSVPESSRSFPLLHVGPCRQFLSELDEAPCPARFGTFLTGSSEFVIFSGLVPGLLGVMFASLHDLY